MREHTQFADNEAKHELDILLNVSADAATYRMAMRELGKLLGKNTLKIAPEALKHPVCVICTVEDADFLARGIVEGLEMAGLPHEQIKLACFWNERVRRFEDDEDDSLDIAPIIKRYHEAVDVKDSVLILAKSIIREACVVKTNLAALLNSQIPHRVVVAAPVMFHSAPDKLASAFPKEISDRFEYLAFAIDDQKVGPEVLPGIGGSPYERLGFGDTKNSYVPELISERRQAQHNRQVNV